MISGYDKDNKGNVVIVELKQWDKLKAITGQEAVVETYTGNQLRQVVHPSYQAWSYAMLIKNYNESVQMDNIILSPCSYLHNYRRRETDSKRDWDQFHNPKDLAIGISTEADVFFFVLRFAQMNQIDLYKVLERKIDKNNEKYPIDVVKGKNKKYNEY